MLHVIIFANVFGARESTGILLPLLIVGDVSAIVLFGKHVRWDYVRRLMPPAIAGVIIGWLLMDRLDSQSIARLIGIIIFSLTVIQCIRLWKPELIGHSDHTGALSVLAGLVTGFTTMIANAAGPVIAIYFLSIGVPKLPFVGTCAWFFCLLNCAKIPFSYELGLISIETVRLNLMLSPLVVVGMLLGSKIVKYIPQKLFDTLLLTFTAIAAIRLMGLF